MSADNHAQTQHANQLRSEALHHEANANTIDGKSTDQSIEHDAQQSLKHEASQARGQAADLNAKASALVAQNTHGIEQGEPAEKARAEQDRARAWYLPGSVAEDKLQQGVEAKDSGGILAQGFSYAARSAIDRDGAAYNKTKDAVAAVGRGAASAAASIGTAGKGQGIDSTKPNANEKAAGLVKEHSNAASKAQPERQVQKGVER